MSKDNKPRFYDLEEHLEGDNLIWETPDQAPGPRGISLGGLLRKTIIYSILLLVVSTSGYYIYLHLLSQEQSLPTHHLSQLPGKIREEKTPQPVQPSEPQAQFIEKKVKRILKEDKAVLVKRGDTFLGLLNHFYHGYDQALRDKVKSANPQIRNFASLRIGQELRFPDVEQEIEIIEKIPVAPKLDAGNTLSSVEITQFSGERNQYWFYIKGSIINHSAREIDFIKINVDYLDDERNVMASDSTYAVGEVALKSGETHDFLLMSRIQPGVTNFELYLDYY